MLTGVSAHGSQHTPTSLTKIDSQPRERSACKSSQMLARAFEQGVLVTRPITLNGGAKEPGRKFLFKVLLGVVEYPSPSVLFVCGGKVQTRCRFMNLEFVLQFEDTAGTLLSLRLVLLLLCFDLRKLARNGIHI